ncbi:MAG TPA: DUF5906 domain-containing protein [Rhizomicrobium sp.]|nr:DUF5906 domain-containing protein [Rhizomicrobium sp.]
MSATICSAIEHDSDAALRFLQHFSPAGPWLLTAIDLDKKKKKRTASQSFGPHTAREAAAWIEWWQGKRNLYFSANRPRAGIHEKASKADICEMRTLHVDVDPRDGCDLAQEQERILSMLRAYDPAPTAIVFSGGGYQAFWLLREPVPVDDPARLEAYNIQLGKAFAADNCHNIDRVMRLPGTVNLPDEKKAKKGRTRAVARVIDENWDRRYTLDDFPCPTPTQLVNGAAIPTGARPLPEAIDTLLRASVPKGDRSEHAFRIVRTLVEHGCDDDAITDAVLACPAGEHYGGNRDRALKDVQRARQKGNGDVRAGATPASVIDQINQTYALVLLGDKPAVMKEGVSPEGRPTIEFLTIGAFRAWYSNRWIAISEDKKKRLGDYWLDHPKRRQYEGLTFLPGRSVRNYYNLWRGFAVEPRPGEWPRFHAHLRDNLCSGDDPLLRWVIGWFASIVQQPEKKVGTSLVIRGKEGTGKTKIGEVFGSLLGTHYVTVSDPRYVTGRFNSHLASCLLLHAEEAFWAGDHAAEGKLKDLITGDTHLIEYKGKEPIAVRNLVRLFVTGNPEWVVPVSLEGRRFAVIEIGDGQIRNGEYFAAIDDEMGSGGREALLYDLLQFDLSNVDLRSVPKTCALLDQKIASLTTEQGWWLDILQSARLPWGVGYANGCAKEMLFDRYVEHANKRGVKRRSIQTQIGIFLKRTVPELRTREGQFKSYNGLKMQGYIYEFPPLSRCRAAFESLVGQRIDWIGPGEWLEEPERPAANDVDCPPM